MTVYYVDAAASATAAPYDTWAKAAVSFAALVAGASTALTNSGNVIYVADNHVDAATGAAKTYTFPTAGLPVIVISSDRTDNGSPPAYKVGTTAQFNTSDGNYTLTIDGSFAFYGIKLSCGATGGSGMAFTCDNNEYGLLQNCTIVLAANGAITTGGSGGYFRAINTTVDLTADASARTRYVFDAMTGVCEFDGLTFVAATNRTGGVVATNTSLSGGYIANADFSGFTNATACEICAGPEAGCSFVFFNCKTKASPTLWTAATTGRSGGYYVMQNVGEADNPSQISVASVQGTLNDSAVYRTGGASIEEDTQVSWLVVTSAECSEVATFRSPFMYGLVSSTGSKTFTVYVANNTADLHDDDIWLEVSYLGTADVALGAYASDQRASGWGVASTTAQTDDTGSTWTGTTLTYMQSLAKQVTVNETGIYRVRVCVGVPSFTLYIDPLVIVS